MIPLCASRRAVTVRPATRNDPVQRRAFRIVRRIYCGFERVAARLHLALRGDSNSRFGVYGGAFLARTQGRRHFGPRPDDARARNQGREENMILTAETLRRGEHPYMVGFLRVSASPR